MASRLHLHMARGVAAGRSLGDGGQVGGGLVVARRDASTPLHCECLSRRGLCNDSRRAQLTSGGLKPKPVSAAAGVLGKRPRDVKATLPPLVAPLAAITGVSLETAELLASKYESASKIVAATEDEVADTTLKSGRRVGNVVAKRVKRCFC